MKKIILFLFSILTALVSWAQNISINNSNTFADNSAILDLNTGTSHNLGFLPPQVALAATNSGSGIAAAPATGLIVYNTATAGSPPHNVTPGYYYNAGTSGAPNWSRVQGSGSGFSIADSAWALLGNAGTVDGTNFIGTTDNVPFNVRVDNVSSGRIDNTGYNTFFGYQAGNYPAITGNYNTAVGQGALSANTTANFNTAVGQGAMEFNTTGSYNTATGENALHDNTIGIANTAIGENALAQNTTGGSNVVIGSSASQSSTTASYNTAIGQSALISDISGSYNVAFGEQALLNTTGSSNTALGSDAMTTNGTGSYNTAIGENVMSINTTGSYNTAVGSDALGTGIHSNTTGNYNTAIGNAADVSSNNLSNATAIGNGAGALASDNIQLGNSSVTGLYFGTGSLATSTLESNMHYNSHTGQITITSDSSSGGGGITGSGTSGKIPLWNGTTSLTNSNISQATNGQEHAANYFICDSAFQLPVESASFTGLKIGSVFLNETNKDTSAVFQVKSSGSDQYDTISFVTKTFTINPTGWASPVYSSGAYFNQGKIVNLKVKIRGTSNSTGSSFVLPFNAAATDTIGVVASQSVSTTINVWVKTTTGSTTATLLSGATMSATGWTASGLKTAYFEFWYIRQ